MEVTVLLRPDVARTLAGGAAGARSLDDPVARQLATATRQLGLVLRPLHPGVADPRLAAYFTADVPPERSPQEVVDGLQKCAAVEAAYIKPPDALP